MFEQLYDEGGNRQGARDADDFLAAHGADPTTLASWSHEEILAGVRTENLELLHGLHGQAEAMKITEMLEDLADAGQALAGSSDIALRTRSFAWMVHPSQVVYKNRHVQDTVRAIRGYELAWQNDGVTLDRRVLLLYQAKRAAALEADPARVALGPATVTIDRLMTDVPAKQYDLYDLLESDTFRAAAFAKLREPDASGVRDRDGIRRFCAHAEALGYLGMRFFTRPEFYELFDQTYRGLAWMAQPKKGVRAIAHSQLDIALGDANGYLEREARRHQPGPPQSVGGGQVLESIDSTVVSALNQTLRLPLDDRTRRLKARLFGIRFYRTQKRQVAGGVFGENSWEISDPDIDRARTENQLTDWSLQVLRPKD